MLGLILFAAAAIFISFLCSVLEATLLCITPSYIASMEDKNPKWHKKVLALKQNMDTPLAAILTLNTVAQTMGAAGVGAQVTEIYGQTYLGVASGLMTIGILVISEILPKSIAAKYWKNLVPVMCTTVKGMIFVLKPILIISDFFMGLFGEPVQNASTIREELKALTKIAKDENAINENKYRVINNVLNLNDVKVKDVMTPRTVVHKVNPGMTFKAFDKFLEQTPFSRFPIIDEQGEKFLGYVHKSSSYQANDNDIVDKFSHTMPSFYSEARLERILSNMLDERYHMALVIDQHETWVGIITLEDIIETILGKEIVDETDQVADMRLYAKMKWNKKLEAKKK